MSHPTKVVAVLLSLLLVAAPLAAQDVIEIGEEMRLEGEVLEQTADAIRFKMKQPDESMRETTIPKRFIRAVTVGGKRTVLNSQAADPFGPTDAEKRFGPMLDAMISDRIAEAASFPLTDIITQRLLRSSADATEVIHG